MLLVKLGDVGEEIANKRAEQRSSGPVKFVDQGEHYDAGNDCCCPNELHGSRAETSAQHEAVDDRAQDGGEERYEAKQERPLGGRPTAGLAHFFPFLSLGLIGLVSSGRGLGASGLMGLVSSGFGLGASGFVAIWVLRVLCVLVR
jgi:hypothetical protein